jgi:hypothetical protein
MKAGYARSWPRNIFLVPKSRSRQKWRRPAVPLFCANRRWRIWACLFRLRFGKEGLRAMELARRAKPRRVLINRDRWRSRVRWRSASGPDLWDGQNYNRLRCLLGGSNGPAVRSTIRRHFHGHIKSFKMVPQMSVQPSDYIFYFGDRYYDATCRLQLDLAISKGYRC